MVCDYDVRCVCWWWSPSFPNSPPMIFQMHYHKHRMNNNNHRPRQLLQPQPTITTHRVRNHHINCHCRNLISNTCSQLLQTVLPPPATSQTMTIYSNRRRSPFASCTNVVLMGHSVPFVWLIGSPPPPVLLLRRRCCCQLLCQQSPQQCSHLGRNTKTIQRSVFFRAFIENNNSCSSYNTQQHGNWTNSKATEAASSLLRNYCRPRRRQQDSRTPVRIVVSLAHGVTTWNCIWNKNMAFIRKSEPLSQTILDTFGFWVHAKQMDVWIKYCELRYSSIYLTHLQNIKKDAIHCVLCCASCASLLLHLF